MMAAIELKAQVFTQGPRKTPHFVREQRKQRPAFISYLEENHTFVVIRRTLEVIEYIFSLYGGLRWSIDLRKHIFYSSKQVL